jgi:hypothetical protein
MSSTEQPNSQAVSLAAAINQATQGKQGLKSISLHFTIPASVDTPSETLAAMKQLCLDGVHLMRETDFLGDISDEHNALIDALLTES